MGPFKYSGAQMQNTFRFRMVKSCLDVEWSGFWTAFQNLTAWPFQIQQIASILDYYVLVSFWNGPDLAIAVTMIPIILLPKYLEVEHQNSWILNGFWIWLFGYFSPYCIRIVHFSDLIVFFCPQLNHGKRYNHKAILIT